MIDPSRSVASVEYDDAPLRPFHAAVAAASSGGVFSDGYGLGIIGISLSLAAPQLQLSPVWTGLLGGAALFGLFAGALLTGPAADRSGRRPFFAYNMAVLAVLSLLQFTVHSGAELLALRLAIGFLMSAMNLHSGYLGGLIYNLALLIGAIGGLMVVDRLTRRAFLIGSFGIAAATMLVLTLWSNIPAMAMSILFALFAAVLSAASNLVYVYLPELFPTDLRASGIGLAIAASRIGSAISTFLLPIVVAAYGARMALGTCVTVLAIGAVICQLWAPETKDLRLGARLDA